MSAQRKIIDQIIEGVLEAVDPFKLTRKHMADVAVPAGQLKVLAVGKAALPMAKAAEDVLGEKIDAGLVITKKGQTTDGLSDRFEVLLAAHPVPDGTSVTAGRAALAFVDSLQPDDLVLFLISGGGSALMTDPVLPLPDWQALIKALLESGCDINELNCVRKQLDRVKGGGLGQAAAPAQTLSLVLSDVVGSQPDIIASGPTVPNPQNPADALAILERYGLADTPAGAYLKEQSAAHRAFSTDYRIIGDVKIAAEAALAAAEGLGYPGQLVSYYLEGEAREIGKVAAGIGKSTPKKACLILAGESTVTIDPDSTGIGGRNLEVALSAALDLVGTAEIAIATFATDGDDGPTGAAGACVDGDTISDLRIAHGSLANHDSLTYFQTHAPDSLIITGQTGTNVNDLVIILKQ